MFYVNNLCTYWLTTIDCIDKILTKDRPDLLSERAPHRDKTATLEKKNLVTSPSAGSTPRHADWLTVSRTVTLTCPCKLPSTSRLWECSHDPRGRSYVRSVIFIPATWPKYDGLPSSNAATHPLWEHPFSRPTRTFHVWYHTSYI
jgi:hypothetical protein